MLCCSTHGVCFAKSEPMAEPITLAQTSAINKRTNPTHTIEKNTLVLTPMVVTATKLDRNSFNAPVPVEVIDSKTLARQHVSHLTQALQQVSGLQLRQIHGKTGYEVLLQGLSGDQVLVLIDGLPISASTGSTVNLNQYTHIAIDRIEVMKGAASAQYGSQAMGGVINVITKPIADKTQGFVSVQAGSFGSQNVSGDSLDNNTTQVSAEFSTSFKPLFADGADNPATGLVPQVRLATNMLDDKGLSLDANKWPLIKDASKQQQIRLDVRLNATNNNQVSSEKTGYWGSFDYYTESDESRYRFYIPPNYTAQQKQEDITRKRANLGGQWQFGKANASHQLKVEALQETYHSQSQTFVNAQSASHKNRSENRLADLTTRVLSAQWDLPRFANTLGDNQLLQLGAYVQQDSLVQGRNGVSELKNDKEKRHSYEAYLQHDWFVTDNLELLSGVRGQYDDGFGWHAAPKLSVRYDLPTPANSLWQQVLRASVGTAYRVPNLKDRYFLFDHSNLGYKVTGNPNLQPETSTSYQFNWSAKYGNNFIVDNNLFYNQLADLIQTDTANPIVENGIANYHYVNVDKAHTYGIDTTAKWQITPAVALSGAYSYTHTKNKTTNTPLTRRPEHMLRLGAFWQINSNVDMSIRWRYQGKELISTANNSYSPAWQVFDITGNYKLTPYINLFMGANNLLNEQRDFNNPNDKGVINGREIYVGSKLHF